MTAAPTRLRNDVVGPGSLVGRYRLVRELGRGAMGLVFLADDTVLKQQLCVKVLDPRLVHNPEALERFHREIVLARRIAHRSVCRLHDLHQESGLHFITMEYVEGVPLRDLIVGDRPLLPIGRVTRIVRNICDALAAAHDVNVIHRDLKPANVMVCAADEINLLDFGIATADDLRSSLTLPGIAIGTRNYIAPEVWAGRPATAKSDQFSLAVLFYNCLTKQRPFPTDNNVVEAMRVPPRPPSALRADVPKALDAVVLRALAFSPGDRYSDVRGLAAAIADVEKREGLGGPGHGFDPNERSTSGSDPRASPAALAAQVITAPRGVAPPSGEPTIPPASRAGAQQGERGADDAMTMPPATLPPSSVAGPMPNTLRDNLGSEATGLSGTSRTDPLLPPRSRRPRALVALAGVVVVVSVVYVAARNERNEHNERNERNERNGAAVDASASAALGERIRQANGAGILGESARVRVDEPVDEPADEPVIGEPVIGEPIVEARASTPHVVEAARDDRPRDRDRRAEVDSRSDAKDNKRVVDARAATQRAMAERGVLAGDDADIDRLRAKASAEAKAKHFDDAVAIEGDARRRAEAIVVDKAFVKKKLVRFNTRFDELRDARARARLEGVSTEVLTAMREGRTADANRALNAAFAAMR